MGPLVSQASLSGCTVENQLARMLRKEPLNVLQLAKIPTISSPRNDRLTAQSSQVVYQVATEKSAASQDGHAGVAPVNGHLAHPLLNVQPRAGNIDRVNHSNQCYNSVTDAGAAYVFVRSAGAWTQQAYLKASNTDGGDYFGQSVSISGDTLRS